MAYKIRQQIKNGKLIRHKVDRRWMMSVIKEQQEALNKLTEMFWNARKELAYERATRATVNQTLVTPDNMLGLPPLPERKIVPVTMEVARGNI